MRLSGCFLMVARREMEVVSGLEKVEQNLTKNKRTSKGVIYLAARGMMSFPLEPSGFKGFYGFIIIFQFISGRRYE